MFEITRYLADFFVCPLRYPNHLDEITSKLDDEKKKDVLGLINKIGKSYCSVYAIQDSVEDVTGLNPSQITKDLTVDFAYFVRTADDALEKTDEDPSILHDLSAGDPVPSEWVPISNFLGCVRDLWEKNMSLWKA